MRKARVKRVWPAVTARPPPQHPGWPVRRRARCPRGRRDP
jgi:hypothetical protein